VSHAGESSRHILVTRSFSYGKIKAIKLVHDQAGALHSPPSPPPSPPSTLPLPSSCHAHTHPPANNSTTTLPPSPTFSPQQFPTGQATRLRLHRIRGGAQREGGVPPRRRPPRLTAVAFSWTWRGAHSQGMETKVGCTLSMSCGVFL